MASAFRRARPQRACVGRARASRALHPRRYLCTVDGPRLPPRAPSPPPPSALSAGSSVFAPPPAVLASRRAEQARFGLPVWKLLGLGLVGVIAAARWWAERSHLGGRRTACAPAGSISPSEPVLRDEQAQVLLADVRRVLERHGMSCGRMPLRVRVGNLGVEGMAVSAARTKIEQAPPWPAFERLSLSSPSDQVWQRPASVDGGHRAPLRSRLSARGTCAQPKEKGPPKEKRPWPWQGRISGKTRHVNGGGRLSLGRVGQGP